MEKSISLPIIYITDQKPDGGVPWVVPNMIIDGAGTGWSCAAVIIPWIVYQAYGDKRIPEHQYGSMKAWVEYMRREAGEGCLFTTGFHLGDWLSFAEYYSYQMHGSRGR